MNRYLQHYGVLGMRWGVRKARKPSRISRKYSRRSDRARQDYERLRVSGHNNSASIAKRVSDRYSDLSKASADTKLQKTAKKYYRMRNSQIVKERRENYKKRRIMTDDELRNEVNRLRLEKEYGKLVKEDTGSGSDIVYRYLTSNGAKQDYRNISASVIKKGSKAVKAAAVK